MKVLVDTSVWSLAFRRSSPKGAHVAELESLIEDGRAALIGAIRQEILSGLRRSDQFLELGERLRQFPDLSVGTADMSGPRNSSTRAAGGASKDRTPIFSSAQSPSGMRPRF